MEAEPRTGTWRQDMWDSIARSLQKFEEGMPAVEYPWNQSSERTQRLEDYITSLQDAPQPNFEESNLAGLKPTPRCISTQIAQIPSTHLADSPTAPPIQRGLRDAKVGAEEKERERSAEDAPSRASARLRAQITRDGSHVSPLPSWRRLVPGRRGPRALRAVSSVRTNVDTPHPRLCYC